MSAQFGRTMGRRRFLGLLGALALAGLAPAGALAAIRRAGARGADPSVVALAHDPVGGLDGIDAVGTVYLAHNPDEASTEALRKALGLKPREDPAKGLKRLRRRIAADFEAGEVVALDGWRLARHEARWAALVHLERSGA